MMANRLNNVVEEKGIVIEEAEDQIGWYLEEFLSNPDAFIEDNPIMFIKDLANFLGIQWLCAMPREISS
jgi:hypothetical protein